MPVSPNSESLQRGRDAYAERSWRAAFDGLATADDAVGLDREDLELLATAAYMLGLQDEYFAALERAHQAHLDAGEALRAARCAIWVGLNLAQQGEMGRATGWVARAQRLVEREGRDCAEQGYLLMARMFQQEGDGDLNGAIATAGEAAKLAERFGDADLLALAGHSQGHMLVIDGRPDEGLRFLDEAMVAVTTGELSPIVSGIVYCGVILGCQTAHETGRAREWTAALTDWCRKQPDMVAFTGRCLVHRAELMQLEGAWADAIDEAGRAARRCEEGGNARAAGEAVYLRGEILRLQGEFAGAEEDYRKANGYGREPQPGLALLRLAQGNAGAALAGIRRARAEANDEPALASVLPAYCEIMLAAGEIEAAVDACGELIEIAGHYEGGSLDAVAARSRGAVALAEGEPEAALGPLREAEQAWRELAAPYEEARTRELVARACGAVGDDDAAAMELEQAEDVLRRLGARPDLERIRTTTEHAGAGDSHGLTSRELEVLGLVAQGHTNKAIAAELVVSGRTVDRHVSNILAKLGVSSRAAATAFAYEHQLL
jgi:ATP/maltotriose-dependent transcriptional regulator MalT